MLNSNSVHPVEVYKEIIFQLKFLAATSPRGRQNLRTQPLPIATTTASPIINTTTAKILSGMVKLQQIIDFHNKFKSVALNLPLERALISAAAVIYPAAVIPSFAERLEEFMNPAATSRPDFHHPTSTMQTRYALPRRRLDVIILQQNIYSKS